MKEHLDRLLEAVEGAGTVLILPHNDPDPDAIASAVALHRLLTERSGVEEVQVAYSGIIGRAENRALVRHLDRPLRRLARSDLRRSACIGLVDTQPGAGNVTVPDGSEIAIVLDHHPRREAGRATRFALVRPDIGATSTLLTMLLQAADIDPPPLLATALFYGIKTDTMGLGRGTYSEDVAAYSYLQLRIDAEVLSDIEYAQAPAAYFQQLDAALRASRVYDSLVVSYLGAMTHPDLAAEMADLLLRLEGTRWALCMGVYEGELILSVRTRDRRGWAGRLAQGIVGDQGTAGGHGSMGGGQIALEDRDLDQLVREIRGCVLEHLNIAPEHRSGHPLI